MGPKNLSPIVQLWALIAESVYAWITNDAARCHDSVTKALSIAQATDIHIFDAAIPSRGIYGALSHDDVGTAGSYLEIMAQHLDQLRHLEAVMGVADDMQSFLSAYMALVFESIHSGPLCRQSS